MANVEIREDSVSLGNAEILNFNAPLEATVNSSTLVANVSVNTASISSLSSVAQAAAADLLVLVTNTSTTPVTESISISSLFGSVNTATVLLSGAEVRTGNLSVTNSAILTVGNSISNTTITTQLVTVSNSTVSSNLSAGQLVVGNVTINTLSLSITSNVSVNTSSLRIGNSSSNTVSNSSSTVVSLGTNSSSVTPQSITVSSASSNVSVNSSSVLLVNGSVSFSLQRPTLAQNTAGTYYLNANGSWSVVTAGSAAPQGANTNVQYNDSGTTNGSNAFSFDNTTNAVSVSGSLSIGNSTANVFSNSVLTRVANSSGSIDVSPTVLSIGNSTVNASSNSTLLRVANSSTSANLSSISLSIGSSLVNSTSIAVGSNVVANDSSLSVTGTSTVGSASLIATQVSVGNSTSSFSATSTDIRVGTSSINATINTTSLYLTNGSVNTSISIPTSSQWSGTNFFLHANGAWSTPTETMILDVSRDESTDLTAANGFYVFTAPFNMTLETPVATLSSASNSGVVEIDLTVAGVSALSSTLEIDQSEKTSTTAAQAVAISNASITAGSEVSINVLQSGTGSKGLKIFFSYKR